MGRLEEGADERANHTRRQPANDALSQAWMSQHKVADSRISRGCHCEHWYKDVRPSTTAVRPKPCKGTNLISRSHTDFSLTRFLETVTAKDFHQHNIMPIEDRVRAALDTPGRYLQSDRTCSKG